MKLDENIYLIDGTMANCYFVQYSGRNILIDAGMKGSAKKIISFFREFGTKPDIVLITHTHVDHIGGLRDIQETFNPDIYVPDREVNVARGTERVPSAGGFASMIGGLSKPRPVERVIPLSEMRMEGLTIVDTPGHTPGSSSFHLPSLNALFVGDALQERNGRYEFNKSFTLDPEKARESLKKILEMHGVVAYPGHGKRFVIP
ncbi:MAG: MBL fold metallo-hydrolase [Thermoplasmata archaeon]